MNEKILQLLSSGSSSWNQFRRDCGNEPISIQGLDSDLLPPDGSEAFDHRLEGYNFAYCSFGKVHFANTLIVGCDFTSTTVEDSTFFSTKVSGCDFTGASLFRNLFHISDLENCLFGEGEIGDCVFARSVVKPMAMLAKIQVRFPNSFDAETVAYSLNAVHASNTQNPIAEFGRLGLSPSVCELFSH